MATISSLAIKVTANAAGVLPAFKQIEAGAAGVDRSVSSASDHIGSMGSRLKSMAASAAAFLGITGGLMGIGFGVQLAAEAETASVAFEVMLGSADAAAKMMADITATAASTPYGTAELLQAGRSLLSFQIAGEQVVPTLGMLGDLASGLGIPLNELAQLYGKARVQGRLFMEDINQLTGRGIPIITELAKQFGVSEGEVRKLVEQGKIGFPQLEKAFQSLTSEGGMFGGMMDKQSKTLTGVISTLKDNVASLFREVLTKGMPALKAAAEGAAWLTGALASLDAGTVKTTLEIGAFVAAFALAIAYVPKIVAGIRAIVAAYKAMAIGQAIVAAMSGPAGWATLAAGAAIAAGAIVGIEYAFADVETGIASATAEANGFASGATAAAAAAGAIGDEAKSIEAVAAEWKKLSAEAEASGLAKSTEDAGKRLDELKKKAESLGESLRTPGEVYADTIAEIREMLAAGLLDDELLGRALADAKKGLEGSTETDARFSATRSVGAVFQGTSADLSARLEGDNALKELVAAEAKAAKQREEMAKLLRELKEAKPPAITIKTVSGAV